MCCTFAVRHDYSALSCPASGTNTRPRPRALTLTLKLKLKLTLAPCLDGVVCVSPFYVY